MTQECSDMGSERAEAQHFAIAVAIGNRVGMATGEVREFDMSEDSVVKDYLGSIVDRAFRLCNAANAKCILVDT